MTFLNKSGIKIPDYLDKKFFKDTLEDGLRESGVVLNEISFEMGSNAGDNYCSSIYRVKINYQLRESLKTDDVSLIVKTIPITAGTQFLDDVEVFLKEKSVYCDVLPRLEILLDNVKLGAKMFYALKEPIQTIVFDDLKTYGFSTAVRQDGLDFAHSKLILQRLAQLHASSMVLAKKDPSIVSRFQNGMLSKATLEKSGTFDIMFGNSLGKLAQLVSTWPGYEKIGEKLKKYRTNFKRNSLAAGRPRPGEISVLNHGDLWTANFMFSYDKVDPKKPADAIFVDFQLSYYCSPACDINFFLNTSVDYEVLVNQRDELVDIYYETFAGTLKALNYQSIPTIGDLRKELRDRESYGLFGLYGFLPIIRLSKEHSEGSSIDSITGEDENEKKLENVFGNERLYKYFKYGLKRFDELGVLDEFN